MAVTVLQSPTSPNVTGTNLVYTLSSSLAGSPQYRYVTDIYESGSNAYVTTIKTYPNIYGSGIIDVANELSDQLGYDKNWKAVEYSDAVNSVKTFNLKFGEQYGTSISSSLTTYTGSSDNYLQVFPGTVYKNEGSFNFNTSSIVNNILSNAPEVRYSGSLTSTPIEERIVLGEEDYHTITILDPDSVYNLAFYNSSGAGIGGTTYGTAGKSFTTLGIGPANIIDQNPVFEPLFSGSVAYVQVENLTGDSLYTYIVDNGGANTICNTEDKTRFAFINDYGFWDYYNVYTPLRRSSQVNRLLYERPFVRYEDSEGLYNIADRGTTQYKTDYKDNYSITTDWLNQDMAEWLKEMFNSPEVFIQKNGEFIPINITNTTIERNLNTSRNKLFQYTIEFKYANEIISR